MLVSASHSISAIAALIQASQVPRPANVPGDGPYFGSPSDAAASSSEAEDAEGQTSIGRLDLVAASAEPASISAAGLAAYEENSAE